MGSKQSKTIKSISVEKEINFLEEIKMLDSPICLEKLIVVQASAEFFFFFLN